KVTVRLVTIERWAEPSLTATPATAAGGAGAGGPAKVVPPTGSRKFVTTYSPSARPADSPSRLSNVQWIPPSRRLRAFSLAAAEKLANEGVTPGRSGVVEVKAMSSVPKNPARAVAAAAPYALCPDEYDGCAGVASSGVQVGSAAVAGLPSVSAARMAVTGRQKLYRYLASQVAM